MRRSIWLCLFVSGFVLEEARAQVGITGYYPPPNPGRGGIPLNGYYPAPTPRGGGIPPGGGSSVGNGGSQVGRNSERFYLRSNVTGSGVLRGPLLIVTQFGGAGGIGGSGYAGGGGSYGAGAGIYAGGGMPGGPGGGGLHPPGVGLNQAYNTLVGLPTQQGQLGGGFGLGRGSSFPNYGFPGYPYGMPSGYYGPFGPSPIGSAPFGTPFGPIR